jgi:5-formyltetrahydrofolate cyclo-ligase
MNEKTLLRKQLITKLNHLSDHDRNILSTKIDQHITQWLDNQIFSLIGGFVPQKKEPNIWKTLTTVKDSLALPVFNSKKKHYDWGPYSTHLHQSKFNIPEPEKAYPYPPKLDICLVPAIGISSSGHRIGWGHGYFDRLLSTNIPIRIGVIFNCQKIAKFTPDKWDIPLTHLLTESGIHKF